MNWVKTAAKKANSQWLRKMIGKVLQLSYFLNLQLIIVKQCVDGYSDIWVYRDIN